MLFTTGGYMKNIKYFFIFILFSSLMANDSLITISGQKLNKMRPFELDNERIVPGKTLPCSIDNKVFNPDVQLITSIKLSYEYPHKKENNRSSSHILDIDDYYIKTIEDEFILFVPIPGWNQLKHIKTQTGARGYITSYKAGLIIHYQDLNQLENAAHFDLLLPDPNWAVMWGLFAVIISFILIGFLKTTPIKVESDVFEKDESKAEWKDSKKIVRFLLYPLNFAITPLGSYSISLTQILFWTFITIFGLVYVHHISQEFLVITPQVLILLGIGGGTALGAKMNAISNAFDIPSYYLKFVTKKRTPKLKDIISIGGQPNIFKFQILAFTIITGCYVIVDIISTYQFPVIPENLITMMGISSLIYLGNEVTIKSVWDKIEALKKEIDQYEPFKNLPAKSKEEINNLAESDKEFKRMFDEIKSLLNSIYS
jgi:HAMP domain-containing protein